jgi:hypothetical protein
MFPAINVAIGITFVFLLLSLIVTAANEIVMSFLSIRSRCLEDGIKELLQVSYRPGSEVAGQADQSGVPDKTKQPSSAEKMVERFWNHPLIGSLSHGAKGKPSYIPTGIYVTTLIDLISAGARDGKGETKSLKASIEEIESPGLKNALLSLLSKVDNDVDKFRVELGEWFDAAMDRVSGWYKRRSQGLLSIFALIFAVACNVDAIHITQVLATDPAMRNNLVNQVTEYIKSHPGSVDDQSLDLPLPAQLQKFDNDADELASVSIPLGWDKTQSKYGRAHKFEVICGILLTAFAASLGAPFWFDTLDRIMNIRGAGAVPGSQKKK